MIENVGFKGTGYGGQQDQHCVKNEFVKNMVGGRGVNLNLDNVFKYTVVVFDVTPKLKKKSVVTN